MKYAKPLGVVVTTAAALTMLIGAATASATALYSGSTKLGVGSVIDASLPSGNKIKMETLEGSVLDECATSTIEGEIEAAGGATATVKKKVKKMTWESCTFPTKTITTGGLEFHWIPNTLNATVTWSGFEFTTNTVLFGSCIYGPGATAVHLGTFKGATVAWEVFLVILAAALEKRGGSNLACPSKVKLTGEYQVTSPTTLHATES